MFGCPVVIRSDCPWRLRRPPSWIHGFHSESNTNDERGENFFLEDRQASVDEGKSYRRDSCRARHCFVDAARNKAKISIVAIFGSASRKSPKDFLKVRI
jgi:hypothetical protein